MKQRLLIMLLALATYSFAQDTTDTIHRVKLNPNARVELNLEGTILLESWDTQALEIRLKTVRKGFVWGLTNNGQRTPYDITIEGADSAVVVNPISRKVTWSIGISTLSEKLINSVHIPRNVDVFLRTREGTVMVNGSFSTLQIRNESGQTQLNVNPAFMKFLSCETFDGRIIVDDQRQEDHYTLVGDGNLVYQIISDEGDIAVSTDR